MAPKPDLLKEFQMAGLPVGLAGPVDIGRLLRELTALDEAVNQAQLRKQKSLEVPRPGVLLTRCAELNKLDLLNREDRQRLQAFLERVKTEAPLLHMSFSAEPGAAFIEKLMAWLRREIHPLVQLTIGMQPNIGAGCIVRSPNKYFDFSLRRDFEQKQDLLRQALTPAQQPPPRQAAPAKPAADPVSQPAAAPIPQGALA